MAKKPAPPNERVLARNRRASHEYHILDRFEAGLMLTGTEVKSARDGRIQLKDGFVELRHGAPFLTAVHISPYSHGNRENHEPERRRKLLLHQREVERLASAIQTKGLTVVPLSVYLKGNWIKVEIALVRGKKLYDKRQVERQRELDREAREAMKAGRAGV